MSTQKKCDQCGMSAHLKGYKIVKTSEDYDDGYEGMEMGWDGHTESI